METLNYILIIAAIIIGLIIDFKIAKTFEFIAEEKGYYGGSYFWWCFFLGFVGWAMVIALPYKSMYKYIQEKSHED